ncbi:acyl-CoA--sterol O-acyltransferase 1-like [Malania oleifera]|uniref:acyl-CoA--sterol O-acyltransferase 1-like n=1 Tax=Malania oleifera TaxID=397392 RepID=UPI0025AEA6F4|nr:acyl-CoA--sterol O-acyltransferase 1-like [Malania oleifera]
MEGTEMENFFKVCGAVMASLSYCYILGKIVPKGSLRLLLLLPIVCLFLLLPLNLSSINLAGTTGFFIAWLANFKLLLFAFGRGPLAADDNPPLSFGRFAAVACLPIKIRHDPPPETPQKPQLDRHQSQIGDFKPNPSSQNPTKAQNGDYKSDPSHQNPKNAHRGILNYGTKGLLMVLLLRLYDYSDHFHPNLLLCLYCFHIYLCLEIMLAMAATLARAMLGVELEPQFNKPYLSSSLQDFWGRRWNLMVPSILRPAVHDPVLRGSTRFTSRRSARLIAVISTFLVSGLMHELIFFYLGRIQPTWEITWFFLLHGACLAAEIAAKKSFAAQWQVPRVAAAALTVGFVMVTGFWLFFPQLLRCKADVRALEEYAAASAFVRDVASVGSRLIVGKRATTSIKHDLIL